MEKNQTLQTIHPVEGVNAFNWFSLYFLTSLSLFSADLLKTFYG